MNKRLKLFVIRMLCAVLVIGTFPGAMHTSFAAPSIVNHSQLGSHDFEFKYSSFETEGLILMGGSNGQTGFINAFAKYPIASNGFPASGQKAVLSLKVSEIQNPDDPNYPPRLQVWQYVGSTPFNVNNDSSWPTSLDNLKTNPNFLLLDTKLAPDIQKDAILTFDVDRAVKSRAGSEVEFLITGPASATPGRGEARIDSYEAPYLTEIVSSAPASASQSTVIASPATVTADGTSSSTITVTVKDAGNNLLSDKTVALSKGSSNSAISPDSQVTNASGIATFTVTNTKAEQATYTASVAADSVTITQTASVTFQPGPVSAAQSTFTANPTTLAADGTSNSTLTVTLKDANNNAISGQAVTLSQGSGSSTITATQGTTDANGAATFSVKSMKAEAVTYTATANGVSVTAKPTVTFQAGAVNATQSTLTASKANVIANDTDSATLTVSLKDSNGNAINNQAVTLNQGSGSSEITAVQGTSDASGTATFTVKSTKAETVTYTATAGGVTLAPTVNVAFQPGAENASVSKVAVSKSSVSADGTDSSIVTVTLTDAHSNPIAGKNITLSQGNGSSTIAPSAGATTNSSGQAVFTVTNTKAETVTYTATDTTDSIALTQTGTVTFEPGAVDANLSTIDSSKSDVAADNTDNAAITVTLKDVNGNSISGRVVTLSQGSGSSTITAVQGTTDASGVATFAVKSTKAEAVTYAAIAGGVTLAAKTGVTFLPGAVSASESEVVVSKTNVSADGADSSTVTVTLSDANNNPVGGKTVTLSQGSGSSTITPSAGVVTDAEGQASFAVTNTKAETVTYTAADTTDSITVTQTRSVVFEPGTVNAALSTVTVSKTAVTADNADSAVITVTLRDSQNNTVGGKTVTLSQGGGSSIIAATQGTTDTNGVATFSVKSTKAESVTYTAITGNVTLSLHPVAVTFVSGDTDAVTSRITTSKSSASANGSDSASLTVLLKDVYGNPVSGREVELSQGAGSSLISPLKATTNTDGAATFIVTDTKIEKVVYTAKAVDENITLAQAVSVDFLSANANLNNVQMSEGTLVPIFTPAQTSYFATVQDDVYRVSVTPFAADPDSTIRVNGSLVLSGLGSEPIELQTGNNFIAIEVLAADGQTRKTYTVQVSREPNKDARLKTLTSSPTPLAPAFDPALTTYKVNVPSSVEQYRIQAETSNPLSTLTVTGAVYDVDSSTYVTNLQVGSQTVTLNVKAQDGQTEANYTVEVIRADARDELKNALNNLSIGYGGSDSWEFVSRDLVLPAIQDGLPVTWSSDQPQLVTGDGTVTRPADREASVILTASIRYGGAEMSRTFLVIVKPQGLSIVSSEVTRSVPIRIGDEATDVEQTPITRKTLSNGIKIDKVIAEASQLSSALQAAINADEDNVRVVVSDLPADPADEVTIDVPAPSYAPLAGAADLNLETDYAYVLLNKTVLTQLQNDGQSLFFRFVPIRQTDELNQVKQQALSDPLVKQMEAGNTVSQIGTPMTIETNYKEYDTTLLFPASQLDMPAGTVSRQTAYASSLYVYIQHSDGEIALQRGTVQLGANGQVEGIAININKFSTFTILAVQPTAPSTGGGNGDGASSPTAPPVTPIPTPTPIDPVPNPPVASGEHAAYVNGYPDKTFRPSQTTTRAEFAAMLWRVMQAGGSMTESGNKAGYRDVPSTHWAYEAIRELQAKQIVLGVSADRFAPNRPLTRAEFATLAVRWQKLTDTGAGQMSFADTKGHWAERNIAILAQTGMVKGYADGSFRPDQGVTRAELVTMMNRLLERGPLTGLTSPTWKDVPATHWAFADIEEASLAHKYEILPNGSEKRFGN